STELFAVRPIIDNNRIPMIFLGGTTVFDTNEDQWIWRPNPSDSQLSVAMALYAIKKGFRNAALVFYTDITNETLKAPIVKTFQKLGGKIVADVKLTAGQTSYRSEVERVVSAHPDVIFTQTDPGTAAVMYANFKELNNLAVPLIGTDLTAGSNYLKSVTPQVANKVLVSLVGSTPPGAAADAFAALYAKLYTHEPLESSNYAYDGTIVMALAIQKAGGTDPEKIVASLPLVTNPGGAVVYTYRGEANGTTASGRPADGHAANGHPAEEGPRPGLPDHRPRGPGARHHRHPGRARAGGRHLLDQVDVPRTGRDQARFRAHADGPGREGAGGGLSCPRRVVADGGGLPGPAGRRRD